MARVQFLGPVWVGLILLRGPVLRQSQLVIPEPANTHAGIVCFPHSGRPCGWSAETMQESFAFFIQGAESLREDQLIYVMARENMFFIIWGNRHLRHSCDANFTIMLVNAAAASNNCQAAKKYGVTACNVRRWRVQKDHLKNANSKRKANRGPQSQFWLSESWKVGSSYNQGCPVFGPVALAQRHSLLKVRLDKKRGRFQAT